jgi:predicted Zn-dependent peptidase
VLSIAAHRHTLDNGLRVVLSRDSAAPVVAVNLWYGVGSRNERTGRTGFAHLFEHMMFQGSAHVPKNQHFELIERAGGSLNGSTWFDRTNYFETVPAHHLELALWLEADRMGWLLPAMTQEKLDNQRDVVKNEKKWRYDNQPYGDWDERLQALVFPEGHPYHHSVIGSMEDLDAADLDDVAQFFRTYYVPNNAVLTVCGDFEEDHALTLIDRLFGEIPAGDPLPPIPGDWDIPLRIGTTVRERVEAKVPLPRVYMAGRVPPYTSDAFYPAYVASALLGTGRASRLYSSLVREKKIAKDIVTYTFPLVTGTSIFLLWATGYPGTEPAALEQALVTELQAVDGVRQEEVDRAIALIETSFVKDIEQVGERADLLSMYETFFGEPERINTEIERLREVTLDDLRDFAGHHLGEDNRAILTYVPGGGQ